MSQGTPTVDIVVEDPAWRAALPQGPVLCRRAARAAMARTRRGELAILLAGDARMRALNREFRGRDKPTNVLSFAAEDAARLGDIALGLETVTREARAQGKPLGAHVAHLVVHGVLHLAGFDHEGAAEAQRMERLEAAILARLGLPDPYRAAGAAA